MGTLDRMIIELRKHMYGNLKYKYFASCLSPAISSILNGSGFDYEQIICT